MVNELNFPVPSKIRRLREGCAKSTKKALLLAAYNWTKDKVEGGVVLRGLM